MLQIPSPDNPFRRFEGPDLCTVSSESSQSWHRTWMCTLSMETKATSRRQLSVERHDLRIVCSTFSFALANSTHEQNSFIIHKHYKFRTIMQTNNYMCCDHMKLSICVCLYGWGKPLLFTLSFTMLFIIGNWNILFSHKLVQKTIHYIYCVNPTLVIHSS